MQFHGRCKNRLNSFWQNKYDERDYIISMTDRDYGDMDTCDAVLKVWLPENVMRMLYEVSVLLDTTISDFIRQVLFIHLYGRYDFFGIRERQLPEGVHPEHRPPCSKPQRGSDNPAEELPSSADGNKTIQLKVNLPAKLKEYLLEAAEKKHKTLSEYGRQVIVAHLLGNR